jgi:hypothetical protein
MTQVTITVNLTAAQLPPETPEVAFVLVKIVDGETVLAQLQAPVANPLVVTFNDVPPGNYTRYARSQTVEGAYVGEALEEPITVPVERLVPTSFA